MKKIKLAGWLRRCGDCRWTRRVAVVAIAALVCSALWSVIEHHAKAIAASASAIHWGLVSITVGLSVLYRFANAAVWKTVLASLGCRVETKFAAGMWLQSETCRWLPGSIWNLGSRVYLGVKYGLPTAVVSAAVALELAITIASWAALVLMGVLIYGKRIVEIPGSFRIGEEVIIGAIAVFVLAIPLALLSGKIARKIRRLLDQFKGLSHLRMRKDRIGVAFVDYMVLGFINGAICWMVVSATVGSTPIALGEVIAINALAWLVGFFAFFAPAGLGVREAAFAVLFSVWIPFDQGLLVAALWRLVQIGSEIICCLLAIFVLRLREQSGQEACQPRLTAAICSSEVC